MRPAASSAAARAAGSAVERALPPRVIAAARLAVRFDEVDGDRLGRLHVWLRPLVAEREQLLDEPGGEAEAKARLAQRGERGGKRRQLGVERVDPVDLADHGQLAPRLAGERFHLDELAFAQHYRAQLQLVQQGLRGVRDGQGMAGGRRVARGRPDLERGWCARKPFDHHSGEQVRLPGGRAHPEDRGQPRLTESSVQLELAPRHVEEAPEVDVVGAGCERAFHHLQVQPVVRAVDADRRAGERPFERRRVARVHVLVPLEPEVARRRRRLPRLQEFEHLAADRPGCSDDGDHGCRIFSILVGSICGSRAAHRKRPSRRSTGTLRRARPLDAAALRRARRGRADRGRGRARVHRLRRRARLPEPRPRVSARGRRDPRAGRPLPAPVRDGRDVRAVRRALPAARRAEPLRRGRAAQPARQLRARRRSRTRSRSRAPPPAAPAWSSSATASTAARC